MKKDKDKSKKGHESTIGKIIYGFLLFLPLFAIGVTCLYTIFNKNAKDSYSGSFAYNTTGTIGEIATLTTNNVEKYNDSYTKTKVNSSTLQNELFINLINSTNDTALLFNTNHVELPNQNLTNYNYNYVFYGRHNGTNVGRINIRLYTGIFNYENSNIDWQYGSVNLIDSNLTEIASFIYERNTDVAINLLNTSNIIYQYSYTNVLNLDFLNSTTINTYFVDTDLSNVFYASIDRVQQNPLFNWAENSLLYTGMNVFTTSLSITTPFIPLLLTYWLIISVVYFLYDIVLVILTVLHRKIHNLQDSI